MSKLCCEYFSVPCIWLYVFITSCIHFRANPHSVVVWMSRKSLLKKSGKLDFAPVWSKEFLDNQATIECWFTLKHVREMIRTHRLAFMSQSNFYSCLKIKYSSLNVKERLARKKREIWNLSNCSGNRTHYNLVPKWTFKNLAKLAKWVSCVVSTSLYGALDCMFVSCYVRVSE